MSKRVPKTKESNPAVGPRRTQVHFEVAYYHTTRGYCTVPFYPTRFAGTPDQRRTKARAEALRYATRLRSNTEVNTDYTIDVQTVTKTLLRREAARS